MVTHDFECNLVLISKSECLKDSEIARARRANAIVPFYTDIILNRLRCDVYK